MTVEVAKAEETQMGSEVLVCAESELKKDNNVVIDKKVVDKEKASEEQEEQESTKQPKTVEKSSSYKEESNFLSDLKEFERKALSEFKSKLEEAILANKIYINNKEEEEEAEKERNAVNVDISLWGIPLLPIKGSEGTDVILLKFLRAREFKVNEAFEMMRKTLQWRNESNMESVLEEELCPELGSAGAAYASGVDREGHPVCYNVFGVFESDDIYHKTFGSEEKRGRFVRWRCQLMEKSIAGLDLRPGGVSSLLHVNDLKNSPGPARKELRIATKQTIGILQDNYPELVAKNIFINVPFWFYALNALLSPFLTQRTKSKFVVSRPGKVTETLLKYITAEEIPVQYGGFKSEKEPEFFGEEHSVSEMFLKAGETKTIEIPTPEADTTLVWEISVVGWEVTYKEEFIPSDEGAYTIIVQKEKKIATNEGPIRNTFRSNEPGKVVLTISNNSSRRKRVLYRHKAKSSSL